MTNSVAEIEKAPVIFIIGSNTTEAHPVISYRVKKAAREGSKIIVADPRRIELAEYADIWMQHRPGTDVALLNGLIHIILKENLWDRKFVEERTEGFSELEKAVSKFTPELVSQITGVPTEQLTEAARIYSTADAASILYAMGITQHVSGTDNVLTLANLAMLTGNLGKPNAGVNPLRGQNNVQGACDMGGLPNVYPGYQKVDDPAVAAKFAESWGNVPGNEPGLTMMEMMEAAEKGDIKALYIMGENPVLSEPDSTHSKENLSALDFLVVQDIFLSETAELADVVLPGVSFAEKEGTFTNTERRVQRVRQGIRPLEGAMGDWKITLELAKRMGYDWKYNSPEEIFNEMAALTPSYAGIDYDRIEKQGLQWPCPDKNHPGTRYLHQGKFPRGKGKFHGIDFIPPAELPDEEYPFLLTTGRKLTHYHTGTLSRRSSGLSTIDPEEMVEINPKDAEALGLEEGDKMLIASRRGEVTARAKPTERVPEKMIFMTFHFSESAANVLTNPVLDPVAKIPEFKVCGVKIKKDE